MMHEEAIIQQYEPMLKSIVIDFSQRKAGKAAAFQDLMQEARIAFLCHIRTHREQDFSKVYYTIWHALYEAARREYPLSISYKAFSKQRRTPIALIPLDDEAMQLTCEDELQWLDSFIRSFTAEEQELILCKLDGMKNSEIASRAGVSNATVTRRLQRLRGIWDEKRLECGFLD